MLSRFRHQYCPFNKKEYLLAFQLFTTTNIQFKMGRVEKEINEGRNEERKEDEKKGWEKGLKINL